MKRIELINFLKGYAILTIIFYHLFQGMNISKYFNYAISFGGTGIHTFIFLSGLSLYYSYLNKPITYLSFLRKRLSKIYIPYVIIVIITALVSFWLPVYKNSWYTFGGHIFLYKMFDNSIIVSYGYHFWFISTIIQFYLVFFLLIWLKRKLSNGIFVAVGLAISLSWLLFIFISKLNYSLVYARFMFEYFWEFMVGMALAEFVAVNKKIPEIPNHWYGIIGLVCTTLYALLAIQFEMLGILFNDIPGLIGYTAIAIFIYNFRITHLNRFIFFSGEISYSLFLVHFLVILIIRHIYQVCGYEYWIGTAILIVPVIYLFSWGYHRFISVLLK